MATSHTKLIERLQSQNADRALATDGGLHPRQAVRCVTRQALQATEKSLGFQLPELVRALYLQVGNGGFGPQYGIVGTKGGAKLDGGTLETCYQEMLKLDQENSAWIWPPQLLPLGNQGCGMWCCVDCTYARLPMILWEPNALEADLEHDEARQNWRYSFWDQQFALEQWLTGWLDGKDEPEPIWPKDGWVKKRLGFR